MKYKRDKKFIESIPEEWRAVPLGTMCEVTNQTGHRVRVTYFGPIADGRARTNIGLFPIADLTPITQWEPKDGEVVAAWYEETLPGYAVRFVKYYEGMLKGTAVIARVPDDLLLKDTDVSVAWWIANGERYEADHE